MFVLIQYESGFSLLYVVKLDDFEIEALGVDYEDIWIYRLILEECIEGDGWYALRNNCIFETLDVGCMLQQNLTSE